MKHIFKYGVKRYILLVSILACKFNQASSSVLDNHMTTDLSNSQHPGPTKKNEEKQEKEIVYDSKAELTLSQEQDKQFFGGKNVFPLYKYNQDNLLADDPMTIIGFPGLTDTQGPTSLIEPLLGKHNIGKSYTMITRNAENETIETHIQNVHQTLVEEDRLHDRLLFISESFGTYPAYGAAMQYSALNVAGMISIHAPWEGISGAAHIIQAYEKLHKWHLGWLVDSSLDYYQLSNYKIPKALATLSPHAPFLQKIKETLPSAKYPMLALAGKSPVRTGPYAYLYQLCKESKWKKIYSLGASMVLGPVEQIIEAYELGNDGLVTTASALAENISNKPTHFKGVVADATHFHGELNQYPKLWQEVTNFVKDLNEKESN